MADWTVDGVAVTGVATGVDSDGAATQVLTDARTLFLVHGTLDSTAARPSVAYEITDAATSLADVNDNDLEVTGDDPVIADDGLAPTLIRATFDSTGTVLRILFSETITVDTAILSHGLSSAVGSAPVPLSMSVALPGSPFASGTVPADTLIISYRPPGISGAAEGTLYTLTLASQSQTMPAIADAHSNGTTDDITAPVVRDTTAPTVTLTLASQDTLRLEYSEALAEETVPSTLGVTISTAASVDIAAEFVAPDTILITLPSAAARVSHVVATAGITDANGVAGPASASLTPGFTVTASEVTGRGASEVILAFAGSTPDPTNAAKQPGGRRRRLATLRWLLLTGDEYRADVIAAAADGSTLTVALRADASTPSSQTITIPSTVRTYVASDPDPSDNVFCCLAATMT